MDNQCYAVGQTASGLELRCCLGRSHRGKTPHHDTIRDVYWTVDDQNPWSYLGDMTTVSR